MNIIDFFKRKNNKDISNIYNFDFGNISYSETLLLSFYAVCNTENMPESIVSNMLEKEDNQFRKPGIHALLYNKDLIFRSKYLFENSEFACQINPSIHIPIIIWLFESNEGREMLKVISKTFKNNNLSSTKLQGIIIDYIRGNYVETFQASYIFSTDCEVLLSVINDDRFLPLIANLSDTAFEYLMRLAVQKAFEGTLSIDCDKVIPLVLSKKSLPNTAIYELTCILNIYSFITTGKAKKSALISNENGSKLNAILELYKGNYKGATELFHKSITQHNVKSSIHDRGVFNESIVNLLWMVSCYHDNSENSTREMQNMLRHDYNKEEIKAAWCFAAIVRNKRGYANDLRVIFPHASNLTKQMLAFMVRLTGRNDILTDDAFEKYVPQWLLLKYENNKFVPMQPDEKKVAENAYIAPQMSSTHIKQQWEYVLENLTLTANGTIVKDQPSERVAYFIRNISDNDCTVRIQTLMKNGGWSSGKSISTATFINMNDKCITVDDNIIRNKSNSRYYQSSIDLENVLEFMTKESRLYVGRTAPYTLVSVTEEMPYLVIEKSDNGFSIKSNVPADKVDKDIIITSRAASSINFLRMKDELRPYFSQLLDLRFFPIEAEEMLKTFLEGLRGKVEVHSSLINGGSTLETVKGSSDITIQMCPQDKESYTVSIFCRALQEGRVQCVPGEGNSIIIDVQGDHRVCVERDLEKEKENYDNLRNGVEGRLPGGQTFQIDAYGLLPLLDFIRESKEHYNVEWPEGQKLNIKNRYNASQWHASIKKNKAGWFEMEGEVKLDEKTVLNMSQLMELVRQTRGRYIRLAEGEYIALSEKLRKQLNSINAIASQNRNKLQISPFSAALLDSSIIDGELFLDIDDELKEIRQRILDSSNYNPDVPSTLNATLRSYQKEGYQWIARLNSWGAGALLADDMGLGKTIQTITYLLSKAEEGPALVVAPASVAPNWKTEFEKFAPSLNIEMLNFAANRSKCIANAKAGDVVITTYGLLLSVKTEIIKKDWTTICLDEAHVIKNRGAKTSGVAMQLKSKYRIMLTGTPVQNHLGELWNLFQFVNPGLLGNYDDFVRRFINPIEIDNDKEQQKELDKLVHPFMLRRTKEKVLSELPDKTEIYSYVDLSEEEMAVYEVIRKQAEDMLKSENSEKVSINTLAEITRLRQAACSAQLIEKTWKGKTSKTEALIEALEPIIESGDAALVFSQFTSFLAIIKKELDKAKIPYLYLDGSVNVKERQKLVNEFQEGKCPVFLISLKAGGLGLNLTRANYVFHLDPWWNPAIEQQATDRAHRIGQRNAVTVYHLLAANTIEEKIKRLHEKKKDLADNVLEGTDMSSKLTGKDLLELVKI